MSVATEWLEQVRIASGRIEWLTRELSALEDARAQCVPWRTKGSGVSVASGGLHSDPTQSEAFAREGLEERIEVTRHALDECQSIVGDCLRLLDSVSRHVSPRASLALEIYYIDRAATWSEVAREMGRARSSVGFLRDQALTWLNFVGIEYAIDSA